MAESCWGLCRAWKNQFIVGQLILNLLIWCKGLGLRAVRIHTIAGGSFGLKTKKTQVSGQEYNIGA